MTQPILSPEVGEWFSTYASVVLPNGKRALATSIGRKTLTRDNPKLFAMVYLRKYLFGAETNNVISFTSYHDEWYQLMKGWMQDKNVAMANRNVVIAPRNSGKSKTFFTIGTLWAAAHGHLKFISAFGDTATTAEDHLSTFRRELETNPLLQEDYPELCSPAKTRRGSTVSDNMSKIVQSNGFTFSAKGIDSAVLGQSSGSLRPDLIIFDDIEKSEANYSAAQIEKRLTSIQQSHLELNAYAPVLWVGTVTTAGSLIHQLAKTVYTTEEPAQWIRDTKFKAHYYPAVITDEEGVDHSYWPERWPIEGWTPEYRRSRFFQINYMNKPMSSDGVWWSSEDIKVVSGLPTEGSYRTVISIDPAVTTKKKSDYSAIAVVSQDRNTKKCFVREAVQYKLVGAPLQNKVRELIADYPDATYLLVETNQGGDYILEQFEGLGPKVKTIHQSVNKEVRAGWLLDAYQRSQVVHTKPLNNLEDQMLAFPKGAHDDLIDAVGTAITGWFTNKGYAPTKQADPFGEVFLGYAS